ncbi:MAG: alcohol dehydrogenase catalytic domain-containing protein [Planctomycetes bacterium]|nr:alcohol dehydrogenase catalytic domain-containing protein [Planctomycetota bacterium]
MQAAFLVQPGRLEIREVPDPQPEAGEIVVRVECALTGGTDLKAYRRGHPWIPMPGPFGHQWAGSVHRVGQGVKGFEPGMSLLGVHSAPCMQCRPCSRKRYSLCDRLGEQMVLGAFAQYLKIPPRVVRQNLLRRPTGMTATRAAFLEPLSCVVHAMRLVQWREVHRVLILGLGSMGLLFARLLPKFTSAPIVGVGRGAERLALARQSRLEVVLDASEFEARLLRRTGSCDAAQRPNSTGGLEARFARPQPPAAQAPETARAAGLPAPADDAGKLSGFDCVIECTGRPEGWQSAFEAADPGAQVLLFGGLAKGTRIEIDTYRMHYEQLRLLGSFHFGPPDVRAAAELLESKELVVEDLVSGQVGLAGLEQALQWMGERKGIKYAVDPWT